MHISAIAALFGPRNVIGFQGDQPLLVRSDLKRFRELTMGKPVIMGRKTYEATRKAWEARYPDGREMLSGRLKVVITSGEYRPYLGSIVARSFEEALTILENNRFGQDGVFVIGGAQVYQAALPFLSRLYLTKVPDYKGPGDVFFPDFSQYFPPECLAQVEKSVDQESGLAIEYQTYTRSV